MLRLTSISSSKRGVVPVLRAFCASLLIACQTVMPPVAAAQAQGLPGMGDGEMTPSAERQLGDSISRQIYRDNDYLDDPVLVEYLQDIWQKLLAAARVRGELSPDLDERFAWTILLGRDRDINAFALPGGYMGVNTGLIAVVGSRDEMATVLGHELSHITQRHISRMISRDARNMPLLIAAMVLGMLAAAKSNSRSGADVGQAVAMGGQAAAMQSQLNFSRDMEREADRIGFSVMTQAGYAPQGAAAMFEKLQYASRLNDNASYPYLRSHPLTTERIADMQGRAQFRPGAEAEMPLVMDQAMISSRARVISRPGVDILRVWIQSINTGEFAKSPPAQQAGMLYAAALAANSLKDFGTARDMAARLRERTVGNAPASRLARLLSAEIELSAGQPGRAAPFLDAKARDRPEMMLSAQAAVATRNPAPMIPPLRDWVATHPRDATAWRALGTLYNAQDEPLRAIRADAEANVAILDYVAARDRFKAAQDLVRQPGTGPVDHYEASIIDTRAREVDQLLREQMAEEKKAQR
ncbi:M48 family metalloprotease [Variovorax rhizosphaerae]|uniref:M48 family metalloprotease n=1 Tax=Variovorax rhizosphaerae TaxID=1836200 RepID=A0ABU8WD62_9BURK